MVFYGFFYISFVLHNKTHTKRNNKRIGDTLVTLTVSYYILSLNNGLEENTEVPKPFNSTVI